jgi:hypothetical protein
MMHTIDIKGYETAVEYLLQASELPYIERTRRFGKCVIRLGELANNGRVKK